MLPITVARSSSGGMLKSQEEGAILVVFFPIDNALYSIAFGNYRKTAKPFKMTFGMMTRVDPRYHVLDGVPDAQGEWAILGGNVAAHCKVMGHSTVSCAKMAEQIEMPFWMETQWAHRPCSGWGADSPRGRANFRGCLYQSKASATFGAAASFNRQ